MTQAIFSCYPWDLIDESCEVAVSRLAGTIGVDAISVPAATSAVAELRGRSCDGPRIFRAPSGVHFQPTAKYYGAAGMRPHVASWMKTRDPLERIVKAAEKERLAVRAGIECCESETLVARNPHAACVGILGDVSPRRLCPNNSTVREYLGSLVENLSSEYPLQAVILSQFGFGGSSILADVTRGVAVSDADLALLSWCFCPACRHKASEEGLDVTAVISAGRARIDEMSARATAPACSIESMLQSEPLLAAYSEMRSRSVVSLVRDLRSRTRLPLWLQDDGESFSALSPIDNLGADCDGVICDARQLNTGTQFKTLAPSRIAVRMSCCPPDVTDGSSLVAQVHKLWQCALAHIEFSNYGPAPEPCLEWVRQALRYARRDATESGAHRK